MNQVSTVAIIVGRINLPERASALLAIPLNAASVFPARDRPIGPIEFTYPVMRKNSATAERPPTARRKNGSWKRWGAVWGLGAGECSHGTNAVHKCPQTTMNEATPRSPYTYTLYQFDCSKWQVLVVGRRAYINPVSIARGHLKSLIR